MTTKFKMSSFTHSHNFKRWFKIG